MRRITPALITQPTLEFIQDTTTEASPWRLVVEPTDAVWIAQVSATSCGWTIHHKVQIFNGFEW